jgi:hypothetical protein
MNPNYGDYQTNHNYVDPCGLPTPQQAAQIHQFPNFPPGDLIVQPNHQQQRQSSNQQPHSQVRTAFPPPNSHFQPNLPQQH